MKVYTMSMRRNFSVLAGSSDEAKSKAKYALIADLHSGWFSAFDFEIIQESDDFDALGGKL